LSTRRLTFNRGSKVYFCMRLLLLFFLFLAAVVVVALLILAFAYGRAYTFKGYLLAANIAALAAKRSYSLPPNSLVRVNITGYDIASVTVQEDVYSDGLAHIEVIPATKCIALVFAENLSDGAIVCGSGTVSPGTYYISALPTSPIGLAVESTFSWLAGGLVVVLIIALAVILAYTARR